MTNIALEGGYFVLSLIQFCSPAPPDYIFSGLGEEPSPETIVSKGSNVIISTSGTVLVGPNCEGEILISSNSDLGGGEI